jgi:hypothetical protein
MPKQNKELPPVQQTEKELPQVGSPENTIVIGDRLVEIKPTKLRSGETWCVNDIAAYSKRMFNRQMCPDCQKQAKKG